MQRSEIRRAIKEHNVSMLGVSYVDFTGIARMKPTTSGELDSLLDVGVKTSRANFAYSHNDQPVRGASMNISQGDFAIVADPDTFVIPSYTSGVGRFLGDLHEKDGSISKLCTRSFYRRVLERAAAKGYRFEVGFEGEFHLLRREEGRPVKADNYFTHSQDGFNVHHQFITDLVAALRSVNVETTKGHVEGGRGQLEFDIKHHEGMKAADDIVYFKDATKAVARKHGYIASFMPKIGHDWWGNGMHLHMSMWNATGKNLFADEKDEKMGLSPLAYHFIGGLLDHLPALSAVAASMPNSYKRLLPGKWNADAAVYGAGARGAAVRIPDERGKSTRLECRFPDGAMNPYLALGCILACGLEGVEKKTDPGAPLSVDLSSLTDREIKSKGLALMPRSLTEAISEFEKDDCLRKAMGDVMFEEYAKNKEQEAAQMADKVTQYEVDNLLDLY
ncbi:MAG: glutamine synthetase family protein [Thaumarchaeota archaeon]|nr:glutamine synthetase family protein [Nitrososphaerota archaeon]